MNHEHPFAQYVRILGKGPNLSRALTAEETEAAVRLIMSGLVEPVQLGAFLTLLRVKTESPEEVAGFVRGVKAFLHPPANAPRIDLDWPTYAGKSRQLPWFLLAAALLAQNGVRIVLHGEDGHTEGRVYARQALAALGVPEARSLEQAGEHVKAHNLAYLPLEVLSPKLHEIMGLKPLLGVRSPVHTVARKLNPFGAAAQIVSVAHPAYGDVHSAAAVLLGQPRMCVFKGDGGEAERRPSKPTRVYSVYDGAMSEELWPALTPDPVAQPDETMDLSRLGKVWRGEEDDAYAALTVQATAAVALRLIDRAASPAEADALAASLWAGRDKNRIV